MNCFALKQVQTLLQKILNFCMLLSHCVLPLVVTTNLTIFMRRQRRHRSLQWILHYFSALSDSISEDLSTAQILESEDLISYYRNFFKNLLLQCEPLTQCSSDMAEVLNEYISVAAPDSLHIIMPQPCIGRYISHNIVEKYLNRSQLPLEPYLPLIDQHYSFLRQIESNYYTIFTEEGLQNLIESRTCDDSPKELIPYLDQSDVCDFLKKLYQEIETGTVLGLIARPTQLHLPDYLSIYINPQTGLHIYTTLKFVFGSYCCNIHITEESIRSLFLDFFHSLPENNLVYSKEDTLLPVKTSYQSVRSIQFKTK